MSTNEHNLLGHSAIGVLAVISMILAIILQSILFRVGTIHLGGLEYETYPTLALSSLFFLFTGIIFSSISIRRWSTTLPAIAFALIGVSVIFWAIMFYLGSN